MEQLHWIHFVSINPLQIHERVTAKLVPSPIRMRGNDDGWKKGFLFENMLEYKCMFMIKLKYVYM